MMDPVLFMRENIKGKSDISLCDHGEWFLSDDGECMFIEGIYYQDQHLYTITCGMIQYVKNNCISSSHKCQICGEYLTAEEVNEFLVCGKCKVPEILVKRDK